MFVVVVVILAHYVPHPTGVFLSEDFSDALRIPIYLKFAHHMEEEGKIRDTCSSHE